MRALYIAALYVYSIALQIVAALGHTKAKKIVCGRRETARLAAKDFPPDPVWVHVSSLGEYQQIRPIMEYIRQRSDKPIVLSFYSSSGYERVQDTHLYDLKIYLPLDIPRSMHRLVQSLAPHMLILSKYDIWPIMLEELDKLDKPAYLFSGHFRRSQIYFRAWGGFFRQALQRLTHIFIQEADSAEILAEHYPAECISIGGDMRVASIQQDSAHTVKYPDIDAYLGQRRTYIAGSIYPHEIDMVIKSWYKKTDRLILAPHEIDSATIKRIIDDLPDDSYSLYSEGIDKSKEILILDSVGMLRNVYKYATLVYVGGGFRKGIHNIVEPAVHHCRIIYGPKSETFPEAQRLSKLGCAMQITDKKDLAYATEKMIMLPEEEIIAGSKTFFREQQTLHQAVYDFLENLDFITS